jgi:hypothetical protein
MKGRGWALTPIAHTIRKVTDRDALFNQKRDISHSLLALSALKLIDRWSIKEKSPCYARAESIALYRLFFEPFLFKATDNKMTKRFGSIISFLVFNLVFIEYSHRFNPRQDKTNGLFQFF